MDNHGPVFVQPITINLPWQLSMTQIPRPENRGRLPVLDRPGRPGPAGDGDQSASRGVPLPTVPTGQRPDERPDSLPVTGPGAISGPLATNRSRPEPDAFAGQTTLTGRLTAATAAIQRR